MFLSALKRQYNVSAYINLPDEIKNALIGTHASSGDEDFNLDRHEIVCSNKPLTARRIRAVMVAIQQVHEREAREAREEAERMRNVENVEHQANVAVSLETVQQRKTTLSAAFDAFAVKITSEIADPRDNTVMHDYIFPPRYLNQLKFIYHSLVNDFAKVGSFNQSTGRLHTLADAKKKFSRMLLSGAGGVVHGYWLGTNRTIKYNGEDVNNRIAYKQLVEDLVNGFVNEFNTNNPDLRLA